MYRKITGLLIAGIISVLLITGCSSKEDGNVSNADTTQKEAAQETAPLPSEAKIGIFYVPGEGEFTESFVKKVQGYLLSAGVPESGITAKSGSMEEISGIESELIGSGCSALIAGNIDEKTAPAIADRAAEAGIPILFFGTDPGEQETQRWEKNGIRAAYVGSSFTEAAARRADVLEAMGLEKIDENEDEMIGLVVLGSGGDKPGDIVTSDTIRLLKERGFDITQFDEPGSAQDEEEAPEESAEEGETSEEGASAETAEESEENAEETASEDKRAAARDRMIEYMDEYGREIEVVMCSDDELALGVLDAVTEEKRKVGHDVVILGFDCGVDSLREVAAGRIVSTFYDNFLEQSGKGSELLLAMIRGDSVDTRSIVEFVSVTVDNAQEILDISLSVQEDTEEGEDTEDTEDTEESENSEDTEE
ncbi:MAG TPA: hypothetical protein DCF49_04175 [Lachnospiraceae bacterium]|nr:hypothetical protein [Lachnospiraceae bacterium]